MGISIFLEVNYDFARQHSLKKLDVSRTSENPGNHSIGPIFFCSVDHYRQNVWKDYWSRHETYVLEASDLARR